MIFGKKDAPPPYLSESHVWFRRALGFTVKATIDEPEQARVIVKRHGGDRETTLAREDLRRLMALDRFREWPADKAWLAVREANEITWPWRRFSRAVAAQAIRANTARFAISAGARPQVLINEVGASAGRFDHQPKLAVAMTDPMMKNSSVTTMRVLPPPTANSVPEAQPPPSCMPMPNRKAPSKTEMPGGDTKPLTGWPNRVPAARKGKNSSTPAASINICARSPATRRSDTKTRQAWVKPKEAW